VYEGTQAVNAAHKLPDSWSCSGACYHSE